MLRFLRMVSRMPFGVPRGSATLAAVLVIALLFPTTLLSARQGDEAGTPIVQDEATPLDGQADTTPLAPSDGQRDPDQVLSDPGATPDDSQASPTLPGQRGNPAPEPGPVSPPAPTPTPFPSTIPSSPVVATATATSVPRNLTMQVQLDVFSGRPNPSWETTVEETDRLVATFRQLPERANATLPASLGFRGVVLEGSAVRALGYERITIRRSIVLAEGPRGSKTFSDWDRGFEGQVTATAEGRVDLSPFVDLLPSPTPVPRIPGPPSRPFDRDRP